VMLEEFQQDAKEILRKRNEACDLIREAGAIFELQQRRQGVNLKSRTFS
jgi:hypothetical protein